MSDSSASNERHSTLEEQEVHRYYQPWLAAYGTSVDNVASNVDNVSLRDIQEQGFKARGSLDKSLSAFAQLASLRLNVRRTLISLLDSRYQYILAEATRTLSLVSDARHEPGDDLWLGNSVVKPKDSVCSGVLNSQITVVDVDGSEFQARGLAVNDLQQDDRFKDLAFVKGDPGTRFYAGVPIVSRNGTMIGVYAIHDDHPRDGLKVEELKFLQDVATATMEHLEAARDRMSRFKGERLIKGLTAFIKGTSQSNSRDQNQKSQSNQPRKSIDTQAEPDSESEAVSHPATGAGLLDKDPKARDDTVAIFSRAARILRKSTFADGVVFFGHDPNLSGFTPEQEANQATRVSSILGVSLKDHQEGTLVQNNAFTVATLDKYLKAYPNGQLLSFTNSGHGVRPDGDSRASSTETDAELLTSSNSGSAEDSLAGRANHTRKRATPHDHSELTTTLSGVRNLAFLPLRDIVSSKWMAGCALFTTSSSGRIMTLDEDMDYLRAFLNCITIELARESAENMDRAKTTFIASMSHELRSPLHGILGSVEFLLESAKDSYQSSLITSIANCGSTLLDTLSNLLSFAKIGTYESYSELDSTDLAVLLEEVVEAVTAGAAFKSLHTALLTGKDATLAQTLNHSAQETAAVLNEQTSPEGALCILLEIEPLKSWNVRCHPGSLRRIIMNIVGNSLKYTSEGYIHISMKIERRGKQINAVIVCKDTGKGISKEFQRKSMFQPFQQEDPFAPGTGLGLSIVKQLTDSIGGQIKVESEPGHGTEITLRFHLEEASEGVDDPDDEVKSVAKRTKGLKVCFLDPGKEKELPKRQHIARLDDTLANSCSEWFGLETGDAETVSRADADILLYTEPPSVEQLLQYHGKHDGNQAGAEVPLIIVCMSSQEAMRLSGAQMKVLSELGLIVEVIPQPLGPRKMARVFKHCLDRVEETCGYRIEAGKRPNGRSQGRDRTPSEHRRLQDGNEITQDQRRNEFGSSIMNEAGVSPERSRRQQKLRNEESKPGEADETRAEVASTSTGDGDAASKETLSHTLPLRSASAQDQPPEPKVDTNKEALHILLVDDNAINVGLLVKFAQKHSLTSVSASDGQQAVDKFRETTPSGEGSKRFDFILMDIAMPIMDGMEATREIRRLEEEHDMPKTTIVALSAFAASPEAMSCGIDTYMNKPVKFAQLKKLLLDKP